MRLRAMLAILAAIIAAGLTLTIAIDTDGPDGPDAPKTITIHVDGVDQDRKADDTIEVPATAVQQAAPALETDLRDETPPEAVQAAPAALEQVQDTVARVKRTREPLPTAGATQGFPGCRTAFVNNQSSRNGVRPIYQVLHYTVSPNRPGWSDVNAIIALFNNPNSQASSHFIIDAEGNCAYIVPIEAKSWTEAAGNSLSVGYEIINTGSEAAYLGTPGYARLKQVMAEVHRRAGIPLPRGSVYPSKPGTVQHKDGGIPWGGHHDITPFDVDQVIKIVTASTVTDRDRRSCRKVHAYRERQPARRTRGAERRQERRLKFVAAHSLRCVNGKPQQKEA